MTRPLLYVSNLVGQIDPDLLADGPVETKVQSGIDRLLSMQTPSGGFGAWPGDSDPVLWGTAYVVHLLHDAKELGYKVPDSALADAVDWLDRNAGADGGYKFQGTSRGYVYYVLARVGKPHNAVATALLSEIPASSTDGAVEENRMLLQAALQAAGDHRYAKALERLDVSPITEDRRNDWSYYSDLRRRGMNLAVYLELFGRKPTAEPLADLVADRLSSKATGWVTQELMWGITGLGKYVAAPPKGVAAPKVTWDGKPIALSKDRESQEGSWAWHVAGAAGARGIVVEVPSSAGELFSLVATTEGLQPSQSLRTGGNGLVLEREVLTPQGRAVDIFHHEVGDLLFVRLTLRNTSQRTMENVALVDPIPAGWEIENPRLGRGSLPDWVNENDKPLWALEYMDLKDDRYEAFGKLENDQTVTVIYAVRAVTAGTFALRGAHAEAMYDPRYWARTPAWQARIGAGWARAD